MDALTFFVQHDLCAFHVSHSGCGDTGVVGEPFPTPFCPWLTTVVGHFRMGMVVHCGEEVGSGL
jgi:hypothetical protein